MAGARFSRRIRQLREGGGSAPQDAVHRHLRRPEDRVAARRKGVRHLHASGDVPELQVNAFIAFEDVQHWFVAVAIGVERKVRRPPLDPDGSGLKFRVGTFIGRRQVAAQRLDLDLQPLLRQSGGRETHPIWRRRHLVPA